MQYDFVIVGAGSAGCALANRLSANPNHSVALIEAGTGTGKSLAYLVPAILWSLANRERLVVSTNTINLQEQLVLPSPGQPLPGRGDLRPVPASRRRSRGCRRR